MKKIVTLLVFIGAMAFTGRIWAQNQEAVFTYKVGAFELSLLSEGQRSGNARILIDASPEMLRECLPDGSYPNAINAFLLRTPEKIILIDAGLGTKLFPNLHALAVQPEAIDVVLLTHMHGDHIGGMLRDGACAFLKAEVYIPQPEYDYWMSNEAMNRLPEDRRGGFKNARKLIELYKDRLHLFQPDFIGVRLNRPILQGIYGIAAYGHTLGHTMYMIESKGEKLLIWGDTSHAMAIQMPYPKVAVTYDADPMQAVASRLQVLEYVAKHKIPIAGMHIPFPGMGTVQAGSGGAYQFAAFKTEP